MPRSPLQITYQNVTPSLALEARIRGKVHKLERLHLPLTACHVVVLRPDDGKQNGGEETYAVRISLDVNGGHFDATSEPHPDAPNTDVAVALREAFAAAARLLEEHACAQRKK